jgi:nuclear pore complex protein Nup133
VYFLDSCTDTAPQNPLQFNFPPDPDEEGLMQAAEQLSAAVMESGQPRLLRVCVAAPLTVFQSADQEVIKRNHDLGSQMTGRKERLSWLICFINENAVLFRVQFKPFDQKLFG